MKTVLITGASTGIGHATALLFARNGYQVIATMRNTTKNSTLATTAKNENLAIDIRQLDVTNDASVQAVTEEVLRDYGQIDLLINNAGAGFLGSLEQTTLTQAQSMMDVNFFGVWRLTQAVLPSMRNRKSGRIITITSVGGVIGQPFNDAYCAAKFAVEGMMESLAPVVKHFGIQVSLVEPGPVNSDFVSSVVNNSPTPTIDDQYTKMLDSFTQASKKAFEQIGQQPEEVAQTLLTAAAEEQMHFRYQTSERSKYIVNFKHTDPTGNQGIALTASVLA